MNHALSYHARKVSEHLCVSPIRLIHRSKKFSRNLSHLLQSPYRSDGTSMLSIFLPVKSYLVLDKINVDNAVFRLHYKVTFLILVCCSIILSARQYLDDTIACLSAAKIPQVAMNAYWEVSICRIHVWASVKSPLSTHYC